MNCFGVIDLNLGRARDPFLHFESILALFKSIFLSSVLSELSFYQVCNNSING